MNIGILGTGSIARTMAAEFAKVPAFRCEAVCSRQQATGEALAQQFGIPKVYTDYDAMQADVILSFCCDARKAVIHFFSSGRNFTRRSSPYQIDSKPKKHYTVYIIWQKSSPLSFIFLFIAPKTRPSGASGTNGAQGGPFSWKAPSPAL